MSGGHRTAGDHPAPLPVRLIGLVTFLVDFWSLPHFATSAPYPVFAGAAMVTGVAFLVAMG